MNAIRDRYIELRREGFEQWDAFREVNANRTVGNWLSADTCRRWERWYLSLEGLPRRDPAAVAEDRRRWALSKQGR